MPRSEEESSDDEPEAIIGWGSARRQAARAKEDVATSKSAKLAKKVETERQKSIITADLRGADYFPTELLEDLPAQEETVDAEDPPAKSTRKKRKGQPQVSEEPQKRPTQDGLPQVVRTEHNVNLAVLPSRSTGMLTHAPVNEQLNKFLHKALYGGNIKRVSGATMASLKPRGGKFQPAIDFATAVAAPVPAKQRQRGGKRARRGQKQQAPTSTLEQMAARIMQRK